VHPKTLVALFDRLSKGRLFTKQPANGIYGSGMNSKRLSIDSVEVGATRRIGHTIGRAISEPMFIALTGTLGCGKTALVQGLAQGLEVPKAYYITSPTFTLINEYPGRLPLYHVDLYRLDGIVDLEDIGLDEVLAADGVVAVEWAEKLPLQRYPCALAICFEIVDRDRRKLELIACGQAGRCLLKAFERL
jgi:tRNA threonylcarbamoyladenosine biosynthesis protein TsaE